MDDTFELNDVGKEIAETEKGNQTAFERACKIQAKLVRIRHEMEMGNAPDSVQSLVSLESDILEICDVDRRSRDGNISGVVEDYLRAKSFSSFLQTGTLLPYSSVRYLATDEEYLAGACMGMCQDLARYGMLVSINRDLDSIRQARDLCSDIMDHLLDYKFSNSYLKRRFSDTEHAFKTLNTIMYEVTVTAPQQDSTLFWPVKKRAKLESTLSSSRSSSEPLGRSAATRTTDEEYQERQSNRVQLVAVHTRMKKREGLRLKLTGYCSTVKSASRKAIFYLQKRRGGRAYQKMELCEKTILEQIQPIVDEEPPLRAGVYTSTMEEYAKAKLFYAWMFGKEETPEDADSALLLPQDFPIKISPESYLLGLIGLTCEISESAKQTRTERNFDKLKHCLASCAAIAKAVLSLERCPARIGKKFPTLKKSIGRLERYLYEMSLSMASGNQKFTSETSVLGSSSLVPMQLKLSGTDGSSMFGAGTGDSIAMACRPGTADFAAGFVESHDRASQSNTIQGDSSASEGEEGTHKQPARKRGFSKLVQDAVRSGASAPLEVPLPASVVGTELQRTLNMAKKQRPLGSDEE